MKTKFLLFTFLIPLVFSCSKDEVETPNKDLIVLHSTTFASEEYEVEQEDLMGIEFEGTETRVNGIEFKEDGSITCFKANRFGDIIPLSTIDFGRYNLDYPTISDIQNVTIFHEEEITIQKDANDKMFFIAGGLRYESTLDFQ